MRYEEKLNSIEEMGWQSIETNPPPANAEKPFLIYLPKFDVVVSALPLIVEYDENNEVVGWTKQGPCFTITNQWGDYYGLSVEDEPTHWKYIRGPEGE